MSIMKNNQSKFKKGDRVFAKVKGNPYWPALVNSVDLSKKIPKYSVTFYGIKKETGIIKENDLCLYIENKSRLGQIKQKNKDFNNALKEAEQSFNKSYLKQDIGISNRETFQSIKNNTGFSEIANSTMVSSMELPSAVNGPFTGENIYTEDSVGTEGDLKAGGTEQCVADVEIMVNLLGPNWIVDDVIRQHFELLTTNVIKNNDIICLNPVICQAVKKLEDFDFVLDPLNITEAKFIFIPVNDSSDLDYVTNDHILAEEMGGSHWSLLVYERTYQRFFYYDSMKNYNLESATTLANKFFNFLNQTTGKKANIEMVEHMPQQLNSYDCGMYLIVVTELIIGHVLGNETSKCTLQDLSLPLKLDCAELITKRAQIAYLLNNRTLATEQLVRSLLFRNNHEEPLMPQNNKQNAVPTKDWISVIKGSRVSRHVQNEVITCSNRFSVLSKEDIVCEDKGQEILETDPICQVRTANRFNPPKKKHRVLLLADSHGRKCRQLLQERLGDSYCVSSVLKPNATLNNVISDADKLTSDFSTKDYVVVMGGTNDIEDHQPMTLDFSFIDKISKHTNILLPGIPRRYDRPQLNKIISEVNRHMEHNILRLCTTNNIIPINKFLMKRADHTSHGLHLRRSGKVKLCDAISKAIVRNIYQGGQGKQPMKSEEGTTGSDETVHLLAGVGNTFIDDLVPLSAVLPQSQHAVQKLSLQQPLQLQQVSGEGGESPGKRDLQSTHCSEGEINLVSCVSFSPALVEESSVQLSSHDNNNCNNSLNSQAWPWLLLK